ncbi:hypothetical protein HN385_05405 [archaeon]|jgi:hypothetical protein|nr:hypothetical protein [archaeon]MBT3450957.1 hypothetical protein [archaeon]MBT6869480.1 hypothetical protein [archaeon]MBT7193168.1 hypothetical protein [archaeon]MBT7380474.1 hypothetical protein [archaeon]
MIPYLQTTSFTCAASSLLTVMHNFNPKIELNKENEFEIWRKTALLPTRASSIFGLASLAKKIGLNFKVVVEKEEYDFPDYRFYRYKKTDIEHAKYLENYYLQKARKNEVNVEVKPINKEDILKELNESNYLILRVNVKPIRKLKKNTSNYIVVKGYKDNHFEIIDPRLGFLSIPETVFDEAFQTLETKKYRDSRMIVFKK